MSFSRFFWPWGHVERPEACGIVFEKTQAIRIVARAGFVKSLPKSLPPQGFCGILAHRGSHFRARDLPVLFIRRILYGLESQGA